MPAPLALPLGLAAGSSLAWLAASAPPSAAAGSELRARTAALFLGVFVVGPGVALLEVVAAPWANLYAAEVPSAVGLALAIAAGATPPLGERIARMRLDRGDARAPLAIALGGAVTALLGGAIARERIDVVTSQAAFTRGLGGTELFEHRAGVALGLAVLAFLVGYAFAARAVSAPPTPEGRDRSAAPRPTRDRGRMAAPPLGPRS